MQAYGCGLVYGKSTMRRRSAPAGFVGVLARASGTAGQWWAIGPMVLAARADCHVCKFAHFSAAARATPPERVDRQAIGRAIGQTSPKVASGPRNGTKC